MHFHIKNIINYDLLDYINNELKASFKIIFYPYKILYINISLLLSNEKKMISKVVTANCNKKIKNSTIVAVNL